MKLIFSLLLNVMLSIFLVSLATAQENKSINVSEAKVSVSSFDSLLKDAKGGDDKAQYFLGFMYEKGEGVLKDSTKAAEWLQKSAEQGNAKAQYLLGIMHANGEGVPKDYSKAAGWYQKAAEQGNADAQS